MDWHIYTLKNPRTDEVRYVGWTKDPTARLYKHISESIKNPNTHKRCWILSLLSIGLKPVLEIIESGTGGGWKDAERRWIAHYRSKGICLVNGTDGGDGTPGSRTHEEWTEIAKKRQAAKTPEQRSAEAKKAIATKGRDVVIAAARAGAIAMNAARTFESRSAVAKRWKALQTPQQRSAILVKANASRTLEQRSAAAHLSWENGGYKGARTPEQCKEARAKQLAASTPEQRRRIGQLAAAARWGKRTQPTP